MSHKRIHVKRMYYKFTISPELSDIIECKTNNRWNYAYLYPTPKKDTLSLSDKVSYKVGVLALSKLDNHAYEDIAVIHDIDYNYPHILDYFSETSAVGGKI